MVLEPASVRVFFYLWAYYRLFYAVRQKPLTELILSDMLFYMFFVKLGTGYFCIDPPGSSHQKQRSQNKEGNLRDYRKHQPYKSQDHEKYTDYHKYNSLHDRIIIHNCENSKNSALKNWLHAFSGLKYRL